MEPTLSVLVDATLEDAEEVRQAPIHSEEVKNVMAYDGENDAYQGLPFSPPRHLFLRRPNLSSLFEGRTKKESEAGNETIDRILDGLHSLRCLPLPPAPFMIMPPPKPIKLLQTIALDGEARHWAAFISDCIRAKRFDIASCLLDKVPSLAVTVGPDGKSPVSALARAKGFVSASSSGFIHRWIYNRLPISDSPMNRASLFVRNAEENRSDQKNASQCHSQGGFGKIFKGWMTKNLVESLEIKKFYAAKYTNVQETGLLNRMCKIIESISDAEQMERAGVRRAMVEAVYRGNVEFITSMANANPELLWDNYMARNVFQAAIECRNAEIFSLIYGLPDRVAITSYVDAKNNNLLHKVALVPHLTVLNRISAPALQMQREFQWFKELEALVSPAAQEWKNKDDLKPSELFAKSHRELLIKGEKWMKDTSSSLLVVATLIATVTFAAMFTSPGGYNQDTGLPMSSSAKSFLIFMISDAIAMFASTMSILVFLGILTSHYTEHDFLVSLPTKLIIGLSTLFISIAAMIITFYAGISIMFHHHQPSWILIPAICLVYIPVAVFVWLQFPLLLDSFTFTYGPSIFNRNVKHWM